MPPPGLRGARRPRRVPAERRRGQGSGFRLVPQRRRISGSLRARTGAARPAAALHDQRASTPGSRARRRAGRRTARRRSARSSSCSCWRRALSGCRRRSAVGVGGREQRARLPCGRVAHGPEASPSLTPMLAWTVCSSPWRARGRLDEPDRALERGDGSSLEAEGEREVEQDLGVGRALRCREQLGVDGEHRGRAAARGSRRSGRCGRTASCRGGTGGSWSAGSPCRWSRARGRGTAATRCARRARAGCGRPRPARRCGRRPGPRPSPYQPRPKPSPLVVSAPMRECRLWSISPCWVLNSSSSMSTGCPSHAIQRHMARSSRMTAERGAPGGPRQSGVSGRALAPLLEERAQQRRALVRQQAAGDLRAVVEARLGEHVEDAARPRRPSGRPRRRRRAGRGRGRSRPRTSRTARASRRASRRAAASEPSVARRRAQREHLGVGGRVLAAARARCGRRR